MTELAENKDTAQTAEPQGIGGWLILVAIGIVMGPIVLLVTTLPLLFDLLAIENWNVLTNPNSKSYIPYFVELVTGEMLANALMFIASLWLAVLFFTKHRWFARVYIVYVLVSALILVIDTYLVSIVLPDMPIWDEETVRGFFRSAIAICIWVPYMLVSRRVKNTFIR